MYPGGTGRPVQMQMGIESGEVVEIEGDCYGDAVNSAARLAYMCDDVLNLFVSGRFTIGWYVARVDSAIASVLVLCVLLYEVSRLYRRLSESEADLRGLVERAPIGMSVSNEDGTIEVANVAYCRLFGYGRDELVGRHVTTLFPGRYALTGGLEPERRSVSWRYASSPARNAPYWRADWSLPGTIISGAASRL